MSMRIQGGLSTQLNPSSTMAQAQARASDAQPVGQQVQQVLFGRAKPTVLDPAQFPQLAEQLKLLNKYKKKLASMAGDDEDDYHIVLADGTIAMIDAEGIIYVGVGFLQECGEQPAVLVGVLAHEIGHRPKRWNAYTETRQLGKEELEALCRHEETRADIFAGKALAELGLPPGPLGTFLQAIETGPHPEYFSATVRREVIEDAHAGRSYRADARRKLFPDFDRMQSPKGHLGDY